jgi:uncharacterized damage-inducible protein DinB
MDRTPEIVFLEFSARKLQQLFDRIQNCLGKLSDEQIWMRGGDEQNAVGNLVLHLSGNVRQWIVAALGGQPDVRRRDAEFAARGELSAQELLSRLKGALDEAVPVILAIPKERFLEHVTVQKYEVTVMEAVYHVVEHFSQHTGQILFATKLLTGQDLGYYRHLQAPAHSEPTP